MLTCYKPEYRDLWFRQFMLSDPETMSYNHAWGGTISFPEERWQEWYDFWIREPEGKRFYRYLRDETGAFVGEIAYHFDSGINGFIADVIVLASHRGKGYGGEALDLLCAEAAKNGVSVLYDDIAIDNPAITLFKKHGFTEESRTEEKIILKKELHAMDQKKVLKSLLIKDTTREEREQIVHQALWGACGIDCEFCSGCDNRGGGRIESIYQPYIDGLKEIREINAEYRTPFVR